MINCDIFIYEGSTFTKLGQQAHGSVEGACPRVLMMSLQQGYAVLIITHCITYGGATDTKRGRQVLIFKGILENYTADADDVITTTSCGFGKY